MALSLYTVTCIVSIMDNVNQEYGHQCVTHMYLYVQWYTARVHVMQLWLVITERLHLFPLYRSVQSVIRALYCQLGIYGLKIMCASKVNYYY